MTDFRDHRTAPDWTEPAKELTRTLWNAGKSGGMIVRELATEFGIKISRSAVISKVYRMGLPRRNENPLAGKIRARRAINRRPLVLRRVATPQPPAPEIAADVPASPPIGIMELDDALTHAMCRWPVDGPNHDMLYCGAPSLCGAPYCGFHCRLAYRPRGT
jgi:GcrA cell cycle regulator